MTKNRFVTNRAKCFAMGSRAGRPSLHLMTGFQYYRSSSAMSTESIVFHRLPPIKT